MDDPDSDGDYGPMFTPNTSLVDGGNLSLAYVNKIAKFKAKLSPIHINDLPYELIGSCLRWAPGPFLLDPEKYNGQLENLRQVCILWRDIVTGDPALWTHMHIDEKTSFSALGNWLNRSGSLPLTFNIKMDKMESSVEENGTVAPITHILSAGRSNRWHVKAIILLPFMHRCRRLILHAKDGATSHLLVALFNKMDCSSLEVLDFALSPYSVDTQRDATEAEPLLLVPTFENAPAIKSLSLDDTFVLWGGASIYSNLTHLHLEDLWGDSSPYADDLYELFTAAVQLTHLHFNRVDVAGIELFMRDFPVLEHLTHLSYACSDSGSCFLSTVSMPALSVLYLDGEDGPLVHGFLDHCDRLIKPVKHLILDITVDTVDTLVDLLMYVPNVERVDAKECDAFLTMCIHAVIMHWLPLCPCLQLLILGTVVDPVMLTAMLRQANVAGFGTELEIHSPAGSDSDNLPTILYSHILVNNNLVSTLCILIVDLFGRYDGDYY
ncbi:hypothetical protein B0H11DRAFT_1944502 [Mycena galericulata]|nr:hypothetical protein B0H11DRAFT_1944502 [Mycena galericulata]